MVVRGRSWSFVVVRGRAPSRPTLRAVRLRLILSESRVAVQFISLTQTQTQTQSQRQSQSESQIVRFW